MDPICAKNTGKKKPRPVTSRPSRVQPGKRTTAAVRKHPKAPVRLPLHEQLTRKNVEIEEEHEPETTTEPPVREIHVSPKVQRVCYVTNWSRYRTGEAKFELEYIDPFMCTHVIYAYATVHADKPEIIPIQQEDIGG